MIAASVESFRCVFSLQCSPDVTMFKCSTAASGFKGDNIAVIYERGLSPEERFVCKSAGWVQGQCDTSSCMLQMLTVFAMLVQQMFCERNVHVHPMFSF